MNPLQNPSANNSMSHLDILALAKIQFYPQGENPFSLCNMETNFEGFVKIGQGTFGKVYKARDKSRERDVAIKSIQACKMLTKDLDREMGIMKLLHHENVVRLIEFLCYRIADLNKHVYLIMEYVEYDLALLLNSPIQIKLGEIKTMLKMLFSGIHYVHNMEILHRDLKPANILLTRTGILKLADFGLARPFRTSTPNDTGCMSDEVCSLWYRAPELLLGDTEYGLPIDVWSAGCIMAEFWTREGLMRGVDKKMQVILIMKLCGSINPTVWPDVDCLPYYEEVSRLPRPKKRTVRQKLVRSVKNAAAIDLLNKLLTLDPKTRIDSNTALQHIFFSTEPQPCDLRELMCASNPTRLY